MPPVRIGCYGAFWGDSPWAINQFIKGPDKQVDYLVADYLAEVTMGLLARSARSNQGSQKKRAAAGFISEFADLALLPNLDAILEKGIKMVTNAGGLDPVGLKEYIESKLVERGLSHKLKVAAVHGDDIIGQKETFLKEGRFHHFDPVPGSVEGGINASTEYLSLNAYLGAQPIAVALEQGADIVITGRCVDSALVLGPLAHELGWNFGTSPEDLDRLASASLAGHIIECGAQATGGNYTDWEQSAFSPHGGWSNMGYPILTFFPDKSFTISKPPHTGGVVNTRSVCEQMLYEVLDTENYILPDVILDLSRVTVRQSSPDSVLVRGARGKLPTSWLKCTAVRQQGYRISVDMLVSGEQAERKAKTLGRAIVERTNALAAATHANPQERISNDDYEIIVIGAEHHLGPGGNFGERREVVLRVAARHEKRSVLDIMGKEAASFLTNSAPGICMLTSGRPKTSLNFVGSSTLVSRDSLHPVVFLGGQKSPIDVPLTLEGCLSGKPSASLDSETATSGVAPSSMQPHRELTWRAKLHEVATGRSGDKGDSANVAIIARDAAFYEHILQQVTPQVVFSALQHMIAPGGTVTRFAVPGVHAVNFVITKALGGGGLSSLRLDRQAKSYAQLLLSLIYVDIPADVAHAAHL
ncbi:hypothetical protein LRP88_04044 [Fusarium phalaenopsidis]|nr:hypothetical protein NCS56_00981400 [Fusarium sp. Ph1]